MKQTKQSHSYRSKLLIAASIGCLAFPGVSIAQDADNAEEETRELSTVTVTARRQEETLQDVPVTITAISGDTLEKYQVDQVADIVSRVPTLNVQVGGSGSGGQLSLRGVGSSNISAAFDSAVAFDFDGVQASSMRLLQAGFVDVEQIDVLKGPQSLFFGKSASAGVLSLRSANPTDEYEFGVNASYEFEEQGYVLGGYLSGPITDTLGARIATRFTTADKFNELADGTAAENLDRGIQDLVTRATLHWEPTSNFDANLKFNYARNENDGAINLQDINCGPNGVADPVVVLSGGVVVPANNDCDDLNSVFHITDPAPALVGQFPEGSGFDRLGRNSPHGETELFFTRLALNYGLTDNLNLTSVTGFMNLESIDFDCFGYVGQFAETAPFGLGCSDPRNRQDQFTQEFRLTSNFDGRFNFMVGGFYEDRNIDFETSQQAVNISLVAPDPITGNTVDWFKQHHTEAEALSVFASATIDLTDQLELSGGVRYTDEEKTQVISIPFVHAFLAATPGFLSSGFVSPEIEFADDQFSPEVALRYQPNDDLSFYAAYKTGFKSGGIDNSALPSASLGGLASTDPVVAQATADGLVFDSEVGKGGEIGVKASFADNTITVNSSIFRYAFDDLQVQTFDAAAIQFQTFNASEVTTQGIDVDFNWLTPVDGLSISGSAALLDAEFTDEFIAGSGDDLDGRAAARAPNFSGNVAFDYLSPTFSNGFTLGLGSNVQFSSDYITGQTSNSDLEQDSYATIDAALSLGHESGWAVELSAVNLTDEIIRLSSGGRPFLNVPIAGVGDPTLPAGDDLVVSVNRGRQVFLGLKYEF